MKQTSEERMYRARLMHLAKDAYRHYGVIDKVYGLMNCMERSYGDGASIVYYADGSLGVTGVNRCKNNASCPLCSYGVSMNKRNEIANGIFKARKMGYGVYIVTYTFRHVITDELDVLMMGFQKATETMYRNGSVRRYLKELEYIGRITNFEIRIGGSNGYHPHTHQLFFLKDDLNYDDIEKKLANFWMDALESVGLSARKDISCKVEGYKGVGNYITKMSSELTISNYKYGKFGESYSPFQWLDYCCETMDDCDWLLWLDYVLNIRYKRIVGWSRGLKKMLNVENPMDDIEKSEIDVLIHINQKTFDVVQLQGICEECNRDVDNVLLYLSSKNISYVKDDAVIQKFKSNF